MKPTKRFRIAFSFAGEKRTFVARVAAILAAQFGEDAILYDKYHEAEFARTRLGRYLPKLYHEEAELMVVVICPDYPRKEWCGLEWDAIFDLLKRRREDGVILTRFNHATVEGLYSDAGFIELDDKTPEQAAKLILERLALNEGKPKDSYIKRTSPDGTAQGAVEFTVEEGDIAILDADVIVLKHAQKFYGADAQVATALRHAGISPDKMRPKVGEYAYLNSGGIRAPHVLFIGVPPLFEFDYAEIRSFSARTLDVLAREAPETQHIAMTIHGVGYGLDETEAAHAQFAGLWDSLREGKVPPALATISLIDIDPDRVTRLRALFDIAFEPVEYATRAKTTRWAYRLDTSLKGDAAGEQRVRSADAPQMGAMAIEEAGVRENERAHIFVAMPFDKSMDDVFYYGIQNSVRAAGYLCERIDQDPFTGDILNRLKVRIETSSLVIADLTGDNPNVFLEVGYAWGKGRPTVLVARDSGQQLRFDVRGQRCIKYSSIRDLELALTKMLDDLKSDHLI